MILTLSSCKANFKLDVGAKSCDACGDGTLVSRSSIESSLHGFVNLRIVYMRQSFRSDEGNVSDKCVAVEYNSSLPLLIKISETEEEI